MRKMTLEEAGVNTKNPTLVLCDQHGELVAIRHDLVKALGRRVRWLRRNCPKCRAARNEDHLCKTHRKSPWYKTAQES